MFSAIYYLGPKGTHSQEAARELSSPDTALVPCVSLHAVFDALRQDSRAVGVVPVVNSTEGPVIQAIDELKDNSDLEIIQRVDLPIHHCLMALKGTALEDVRYVYSHPQALGQCRQTLKRLCPTACVTETASTALAAVRASTEPGAAAVAAAVAAELHGLEILARDIQDDPENRTRFYVIKQKNLSMTKLAQLRSLIASLDETLVQALCQRAQFRINAGLYRDRIQTESLEELAAEFCRQQTIAGRARVLRMFYTRIILPALCEPGDDTDNRKCISTDGSCMNALVQRLNLAEHVASLKSEEMPDSLRVPYERNDSDAMEEAITNHLVEAQVIHRTLEVARQRFPSAELSDRIANLYEHWIIPLSRKIQVYYLLKR